MHKLMIFIFLIMSQICSAKIIYKPKVWIISDGTRECKKFDNGKGHIGDPDDISAIAGYLLMSNLFDTRGIVVGSTHHKELAKVPSEKEWCDNYFTKAYQHDLPYLNKNIGGYQDHIDFHESSLKKTAETYNPKRTYKSLKKYNTVELLLNELSGTKDTLNVLSWGTLTEPAILINYCMANNKKELLKRMRIISHWTSSYYHVGTMNNPDSVHNAFNDANACKYVKEMAKKGYFKFYECGAIGEYGIVRNGPKGSEYYNQFKTSELGKIFVTGKYVSYLKTVDDSDCASYWVLLGNWGVSIHDISDNGTNSPETEMKNENAFKHNSKSMRDELLRRSRAASSSYVPRVVNIPNVYPEKGLTDPHVLVDNGRVYMFCGHDQSWDTKDTWRMDRWEIHSSTDLMNWRKDGEILPTQTYIGNNPNCWGGYIIRKNDKYYWYFSDKYLSTGVMVADSPQGPWKDALGKPLLPTNIVPKIKPYDPSVYEENGVYTIIFGAGYYQAATLGDDMISLASEPKEIKVYRDGKIMWTADKSTLFKHNGIYYLVWGSDYATSDKLYGPYNYRGAFLSGGHNDVFQWNNQMYAVVENKDLGLFYRGVSLKPLYFNADGSVKIPKDDKGYPSNGREWKFDISRMGWHAVSGTNVEWNKDRYIEGKINGNAIIENIMWGNTDVKSNSILTIKLKNKSAATKARLDIAILSSSKGDFWNNINIDWQKQSKIDLNIKPNCNEIQEFKIKLSDYNGLVGKSIQQIRFEPSVGSKEGEWELHYLGITK